MKHFFSRHWVLLSLIAIVFFYGGIVVSQFFPQASRAQILKLHPRNSNYTYVNPLVGVDIIGSRSQLKRYAPLKQAITDYVAQTGRDPHDVAVYFRDLENVRWMGINEDEFFSPASLLKVPILIAYLKKAEEYPALLKRTLRYNGPLDDKDGEGFFELTPHTDYTTEELLRAMIVRSDNGAKNLLFDNIEFEVILELLNGLDVRIGEDSDYSEISPKIYSMFFRTLYNATYLSPEMSEKALALLAEVEFKDGLVAGVPASVKVAHKFGIDYTAHARATNTTELHDCGIVYFPGAPYFLCVMTKHGANSQQGEIIRHISKIVYDFVVEEAKRA